ncbi:MMPL family transporter, partial [bacterium]|nr:MMPL family transporter [bacterium]
MLERLGALVARRRSALVALAFLATLPLAWKAAGVPLDNSVAVWLVEDSEKLQVYSRFRRAFGSDDLVIALVRGTERSERAELSLLEFVRDFSKALENEERFPEVESVASIVQADPDDTRALLDREVGGARLLPDLRWKLESPLARSLHLLDLAHDRAAVAIVLREGPPAARRAFLERIEPFRDRARREKRELLLAGQAIVNVELDSGAREVDTVFLPLLIAVCVVAMLVVTRSARITALVLVPVALSVLWVLGLVGATGRSMNLILVIVKPLTFVLVLATATHVAQSYVQGLREGMDRSGAAVRAFAEKTVPCLFTSIVTAHGFGSLATAGVRPIRELGFFAAAGILLSFLLVAGPLVGLLAGHGPSEPPPGSHRFGAGAERAVRAFVRTRSRAAAVVLSCIALCILGGEARRHLRVDTNAVNYFKEERPVRREYEEIEREGLGLYGIEVVARARDGSSIGASASALAALRSFEEAARARSLVTATISFASVLADQSFRGTRKDTLPDASFVRDALEREDILESSRKLLGEGEGKEARALRVTVLARTGDSSDLLALGRELERDFERTAGRSGLVCEVTGTYPLILATQEALVATLARSLDSAAVAIAITLLVLVRSPRRAALAVLPSALPILLDFEVMRAAGIALDVGTVMTSAILLGIAVDNTVHFLFHYARARGRGEPREEAVAIGAREAGRSIVATAAITIAGFLTLCLSSFGLTATTTHAGRNSCLVVAIVMKPPSTSLNFMKLRTVSLSPCST